MDVKTLTRNFGNVPLEELLSDWRWLIDDAYSPLLMTAFGDLFLKSETGGVYFLDLVSGEFNRVAATVNEFETLLRNPEKVEEWLMPDLVMSLREQGMTLEDRECYGYKIPPVLGGEISVENVEPSDLAVYFSILGQIHHQVHDLPPGTPITGFTVDGEEP